MSGGIILTSPYFFPSSAILWINLKGSLNSSSVGRYVGASNIPCGRHFFGCSFGVGIWRFSTEFMSKPAARLELKGAGVNTGGIMLPFILPPPPFIRVVGVFEVALGGGGDLRVALLVGLGVPVETPFTGKVAEVAILSCLLIIPN